MRRARSFAVIALGAGLLCLLAVASDELTPAVDVIELPGITITVSVPDGDLPLHGSILIDGTIEVLITLPDGIQAAGIWLTPGGGESDPFDDRFPAFVGGQTQGTLDLASGDYSLTVAGGSGDVVYSATAWFVVIEPDMFLVSSALAYPIDDDSTYDIQYETGTIMLAFSYAATVPDMSALLRAHGLAPLDVCLDAGLVRARIDDDRSPIDVMIRLDSATREDQTAPSASLLVGAMPNLLVEDDAVRDDVAAGERMPDRLTASYQTASRTGCDPGGASPVRGCFDHDLDFDDELRIFRYHAFMDTFAAHRLVERLVPAPVQTVGLAIVDRGLGNGVNTTDIPDADLFHLSAAPYRFDDRGVQTRTGVLPAPLLPPPTIAGIADAPNSHGTGVTTAAAGRGTRTPGGLTGVLGTGLHVMIRPIRRANPGGPLTWANSVGGVLGAIRDASVDVVNTSWGALGGARWPFGLLFTRHAVDGVRYNVVRLAAQPYLDYGRDRNRNVNDADGSQNNGRFDFADGNGNGIHDVGEASEPFYDRDGDGRFSAGDALVWVATAGNNGRDFEDRFLPGAFALIQTASRRNDPFDGLRVQTGATILAVSGSETANRVSAPEQLCRFSNFGRRVSVSAGGGDVIAQSRTGALEVMNGTSFAAPQVAGLAAEMIYLDKNLRAAAGRMMPLQIIEIVEGTADDLGSTESQTASWRVRPNDAPGNGPDVFFGHGRINCWKAVLSVVNGGLAAESHTNGRFGSLTRIQDPDTDWYGFKIHSPVHEATVWLDGAQLIDPGTTAPQSPSIVAYAGVRSDRTILIGIDDDSDGILDEDPTSGVVPVGNRDGEYLMTFSIEGPDLRNAERLELRTPDGVSFYTLDVRDTPAMRRGEVPGVVFDDFVFYVTPVDFGDADRTQTYSVTLVQTGSRHVNSALEWFGRSAADDWASVSGETDAFRVRDTDSVSNAAAAPWNADALDDGVVFHPETLAPNGVGRADFTVCVADPASGRYGPQSNSSVFVNAWVDWNADGDWDDPLERIVDGARINPAAGFAVADAPNVAPIGPVPPPGNCQTYSATFPLPARISQDPLWARFRLDYGENVGVHDPQAWNSLPGLAGYRGPARFGEVEDHLIGGDFGDAPDPAYPTRLQQNGARHVTTDHEWLGKPLVGGAKAVSEEHGAADPIDVDGTPNLRPPNADLDRFDDGIVFFPLTYVPGRNGVVEFTVGVANPAGGRYGPQTNADRCLFVNGWIDWNTDGNWTQTGSEHIVNGVQIDPSSDWAVVAGNAVRIQTGSNFARYRSTFPVQTISTDALWSRFRLDYGENVGRNDPRPVNVSDPSLRDPTLPQTASQAAGQRIGFVYGAARFGEVEDYLIGSDFGDAPDPYRGPGRYPTRKASDGARHLDMTREWLGFPGDIAEVTRETDGCDMTTAEQDRVPNLGPGCVGADHDGLDGGVFLPAVVKPGEIIPVRIYVSAKIDAFGFANRGPTGQDSAGVQTMKPPCVLGPIPNMPDTPVQHRDRGRYAAWDPRRRLYLNAWADWNANGIWENNELVISAPLDPEDWGGDGVYTLGEPFVDADGNGVWLAGEAFTDVAGVPLRGILCEVAVPWNVAMGVTYYWRFRLDYGENVANNPIVVHHATETNRALNGPKGGALWGEVEDYPQIAYEIDEFPCTYAAISLSLAPLFDWEFITLKGTSTLEAHFEGSEGVAFDTDGDGLDQVITQIADMDLRGESALLGPMVLRSVSSMGEIEESENLTAGVLDLAPFGELGTATGYFDVRFEVEFLDPPVFVDLFAPDLVFLHNEDPFFMEATIGFKPVSPGDTYWGRTAVDLVDAPGTITAMDIGPGIFLFDPSVEVSVCRWARAIWEHELPLCWTTRARERLCRGLVVEVMLEKFDSYFGSDAGFMTPLSHLDASVIADYLERATPEEIEDLACVFADVYLESKPCTQGSPCLQD